MKERIEKLVSLVDEVGRKYGLSFATALEVVKAAAGGIESIPCFLLDNADDCECCDDDVMDEKSDDADEGEVYPATVGRDGRLHIPVAVLDRIYELTYEMDTFTVVRIPKTKKEGAFIMLVPGDKRNQYPGSNLVHANSLTGTVQILVKNQFKPSAELDIYIKNGIVYIEEAAAYC